MFAVKTTTLQHSGVLSNLVRDYVEQKENLKPFYGDFPNKEGFTKFLARDVYSSLDRQLLLSVLLKQASIKNTSEITKKNIELLKNKNTFTVTTGHQLCLFSGPLYFIYKIISTINLAEELNTQFPDKKFIPVYWLASEDHDFEEVSHFNVFGKTIKWESEQKGAVGDFNTKELEALMPSIKETFGGTENGNYLVSLFENAYLKHSTLSEATRYLVNELFGQYGLVTVDGNNPELKKQFTEQLKKDIFENTAHTKVSESIAGLNKLNYDAQVNPRPVNCFYMEKGLRARIESENGSYKVVGTSLSFSKEQMLSLIENEPWKISPNVVLRPLYQQSILPNAAYIGGPGELAYWLQYKKMFDEFKITFPVLVPRSFVTVFEKNIKNKIDKLNFEQEDIFTDEEELIKIFRVRSNNMFDLTAEKENIESIYSEISDKINSVDKTLVNSVGAEKQKALNSIDAIVGKANKALKQKADAEISQVRSIKEKLFPGKIPQERYDNFAMYYVKWGPEFLSFLKKNLNPLLLKHFSVIEE